jgi:hypothetical protein
LSNIGFSSHEVLIFQPGAQPFFAVPLDYQNAGQIRDDDLYTTLVAPMAKGVFATCIMDCCHSGSVLDLPYVFIADGQSEEMVLSPDFDFGPLLSLFQKFMASQAAGGGGGDPVAKLMSECGGCNIL